MIESHDVPERDLVPRLVSQLGSQWSDFYVLCYVKFDLLLKAFCVFITVNCNFWSVQIRQDELIFKAFNSMREPQSGTSRKQARSGDSKDEVQLEEQAGGILRAERAVARQKVPSRKGPEHAVGHRDELRQKAGDTCTGRSSDGYRNNYSERGNAGNEKRGRMKEPVT